jgi:predicted Zn finger-like uncharacterized protein
MKIICDSCGTKYSISDDKVRGKVFKIRCKKCSHIIVVRGGEAPAEAAAPAAEGGWHVVVDGEQVGPIAEADVRARIERGELKADTYTWREGFADWLKLSAVPEFADLVGGGGDSAPVSVDPFAAAAAPAANGAERARKSSGARNSLFGGAAAASSDVFAAPAASAPRGGDLFSASAAAPAAETRWPGSGPVAAGHDGGRVENLTGQRHENSVLFSLANLQSLAMTSPSKAAATAPAGAGMGAPAPEGSGLIDIRAMAASTLGGPAESGGLSGGRPSDDLPAFGSFSPAAPVLLPLQGGGAPKWIYPVVALMVALVAVTIFFAWKLLTAKSPLEPVQVVVQAPAPPPAAEPAKPVAGKAEGANDGRPSTIPDDKLPPRGDGASAKAEGKSEGKSEKGEHHHGKGGASKEKKVASADDGKKGADSAPDTGEKKPAKGSIDDLLLGAVPKKSGASKSSSDDDPSSRKAAEGAGPLAKNAVVAGMNAVKPKINDCYNQFKVPGMAMVNVVILKSGKVGSATVTGKFAGTPTGSCVEKAVKGASFPPSDGLTTPYPFNLK